MEFLRIFLNSLVSEEEPQHSKSLGRNDLCWCGSGKKYKKCHLEEDERKRSNNIGPGCGPT